MVKKAERGRTAVADTPIVFRGDLQLAERTQGRAWARLERTLVTMAPRIERLTLRFDDINGPRGGIDTRCRMKAVVSGAPSVVIEQTGQNADQALARAMPRLQRALRSLFDKQGGRMPSPTHPAPRVPRRLPPPAPRDEGSFIGRRVGRAQVNLDRALERPEKERRDVYVDTAAPGVSASNRRAGGQSTARRNSRKPRRRMTVTLEDSRRKPSRKSTRRSANRTKGGTPKTRRQRSRAATPRARHRKGK